MQCCPLSSVKHRVTLGEPLPFNVRNTDGTLLLAAGKVIQTQDQLDALFDRGALVDKAELSPTPSLDKIPANQLPALWDQTFDRVSSALKASAGKDFTDALDQASAPVLALIERDPDLAIFQVVRQEIVGGNQHGVSRSMHTAIACRLAAQRLGWTKDDMRKVFKAALTMNLAMLELQGKLALQTTPLTPAQREAINGHPMRSVEALQAAGIQDKDWLDAVAQHHEMPDGTGYPNKLHEVTEMASLLRRADIYTAKLTARASRAAVPAHEAARSMFVQDQRHPMVAALVKEFGVYPPGCCVRLASGEVGVVIKRGETANAPVIATLINKHGEPVLEASRRATNATDHAVVEVLNEKNLKVRISRERLAALGGNS